MTAGTGENMTTVSTDRVAELQARLDELSDRVDKLRPALERFEPPFDAAGRASTKE